MFEMQENVERVVICNSERFQVHSMVVFGFTEIPPFGW